jgi:type II secretory pathway predicted ATPase ExeA
MYLSHFQLREEPFGSTPDPRFLYQSKTHREALATLYYGYYTNRGFTALVAQPGMGKTTLLFQFLQNIKSWARTAFLFQTQCDTRELFRYLLYDLGLQPGADVAEMHQQLNRVLVEEARAGRRVVLVIDEAQNLPDEVLETVRLLSDFETPRAKLLQIVLAGQPQLSSKLASPGLEQLRQRISLWCRLDGFSGAETIDYMRRRLEIAGHTGPLPFTAQAVDRIAEHAQGNPRQINTLCFNALSLCCALKGKQVDAAMVEEAIADQDFGYTQPPSAARLLEKSAVQQHHADTVRGRSKSPRPRHMMLTAAAVVSSVVFLSGFRTHWRPEVAAAAPRATAPANSEALASAPSTTAQFPPIAAGSSSPQSASQPEPDSIVVTVAPKQTLRALSLRYLGDFGARRLEQIELLNPGLDPNQIEVGQHIRLPGPARQANSDTSTLADRN